MLPGDRLIVVLVNPLEVGATFKKWPLHVTVVPWFRLNESSDALVAGLQRALTTVGPFEAAGDGEAWFGPQKNRHVRLLAHSEALETIARKVRQYLHKKRAWLVDETTKQRHEFRPHVTDQGTVALRAGERFSISQLCIVEQKGDYKEVVGVIELC